MAQFVLLSRMEKPELKKLLVAGRFKKLFGRMKVYAAKDPDLEQQIIAAEARYSHLSQDILYGRVSSHDAQNERALIVEHLARLIEQLPEDYSKQQKRLRLWWLAGILVLAGSAYGFWRMTDRLSTEARPFYLTVYVHGPAGPQDIVVENSGELVLDLGNDRRVVPIGAFGRVNFGEIPGVFSGDSVLITVRANGFEPVTSPGRYRIGPEPVYLPLQPSRQRGRIEGYVKDLNTLELLPGVLILAAGEQTSTDSVGRFRLLIPSDKIQDKYLVNASKNGYEPGSEYCDPLAGEFEIRLQKR